MKKIFLYAMMTAGVLASCSQSDEGNNGYDNPLELSADAILISAVSPSIAVDASTRSQGSVGADGANLTNKWDGQELHMFAFPKNATTGETIDEKITQDHAYAPLFNNVAIAKDGVSATIEWSDGKTVYFPRNGAYDFFGYYADDATTGNPTVEAMKGTNVCYVPFTIDGSQDLMTAKAALTDEDKTKLDAADYNKAYSSYTARKNVQPNMKFEHLLTRLVFNIKGQGDAKPEEVYVRSIKVKSQSTGKLVFAYSNPDNKGIAWNGPEEFLALQERTKDENNNKIMQLLDKARWENTFDLYAKNPDGSYKFQKKATLIAEQSDLSDILGKYHASVKNLSANLVGETLLVNPGVEKYELEVEVMQYYDADGNLIPAPEDPKDYYTDADKRYYKYGGDEKNPFVLNANEVKKTGSTESAGIDKFEASASYNVTIAVYGLQQVLITAELGEWKDGGDIEVNPDDKFNE